MSIQRTLPYKPSDWYWVVASDTTQVYSSAAVAYVPVSDPRYVAWRAAGGQPTQIATEAELQAVLSAQFPGGWPQTLAQKAAALLNNGLTIVSATNPDINAVYAIDIAAQDNFSKLYNLIQKNGGTTFPVDPITGQPRTSLPWKVMSGGANGVVVFTSLTDFINVETAVGNMVLALDLIIATGIGTLPTMSINIP